MYGKLFHKKYFVFSSVFVLLSAKKAKLFNIQSFNQILVIHYSIKSFIDSVINILVKSSTLFIHESNNVRLSTYKRRKLSITTDPLITRRNVIETT